MNRLCMATVISISICITACVASIPESPRPVATADNATDMPKSNYVCKRERQTGSNRAKNVCRTRAQIAQEELEGKDTFEDLHRSQDEYD